MIDPIVVWFLVPLFLILEEPERRYDLALPSDHPAAKTLFFCRTFMASAHLAPFGYLSFIPATAMKSFNRLVGGPLLTASSSPLLFPPLVSEGLCFLLVFGLYTSQVELARPSFLFVTL